MFEILKKWVDRHFSDPQILTLVILLVVGVLGMYAVGRMVTPAIAALVIAYLLEGPATRLQKFKVPRLISVIIVFVGFIAVVLALLVVLMPMIMGQVGQLLQDLPKMVSHGQKQLVGLPERYPEFVSQEQIKEVLSMLTRELTELGQRVLSLSLASVKGLMTILVYFILVPLLVFFFLKDKEKILDWFQKFLPAKRRVAGEVWLEVNHQVSRYVQGKIWEILIVGVVSYTVFLWLELKFALLLGVLVGLSVIIPYIGATVITLPVGLFAFFQWGLDPKTAWVLVAYGIIQALDGNLLAPLLLSGVVNLHPVAIILAILIFGGLWGVWGLFFAIPLATLVHAVIRAWFSRIRETRERDLAACEPAETT